MSARFPRFPQAFFMTVLLILIFNQIPEESKSTFATYLLTGVGIWIVIALIIRHKTSKQ